MAFETQHFPPTFSFDLNRPLIAPIRISGGLIEVFDAIRARGSNGVRRDYIADTRQGVAVSKRDNPDITPNPR